MNQVDTIEKLNQSSAGTLLESLQIRFIQYGDDSLSAEMPVNNNTIQPYGFLHGGATMALSESVGGALSLLSIDSSDYIAVGVEINGNHLLPVMDGKVIAHAKFLHKGNSIHVLDIKVTDSLGRLISVGRLTNKILKRGQL
jgi:1,4-dihydroxy-2-naphthoyl-CoA hydrolase